MNDYDSDSSNGEDIETNVLLGYASKTPTSDTFSRLGGHPTWLDGTTSPSGIYATCGVCNGFLSLLLQLHGDLPDRYPNHERRLYVWACRRKACRRREGSVRALRAVRASTIEESEEIPKASQVKKEEKARDETFSTIRTGLGEALFAAKPSSTSTINPFAAPSANGPISVTPSNPFAAPTATKPTAQTLPSQERADQALVETFAQKARLSSPSSPSDIKSMTSSTHIPSALPHEPWPPTSSFPKPFPSSFIDADKEYLDAIPTEIPSNARLDPDAMDMDATTSSNGAGGASSGGKEKDLKDVFESSMDKTFQRFADRLAQNPEQILRYEFGAQPLLYSRSDRVGKLLAVNDEQTHGKVIVATSKQNNDQRGTRGHASIVNEGSALAKVQKCANCGSQRVFELQLTPNAIAELEEDEVGLDGMDWGTIILAVCARDCTSTGAKAGQVGYVEEWVGVQWEEVEVRKK